MATRNDKTAQAEKKTFAEATEDFLRKYRVVLLGLAIAASAAVIGAIAWTFVNKASLDAQAVAIEKVNKSFEAWYSADDAKKGDLETALRADIDQAVKQYGNAYAGLKALLVKGRMHFEKKEFADAQKAFMELYEKGKKFDLGIAALRNAASCAMSAGDDAKAIELYGILVKDYATSDGYAHDAYVLGLLLEDAKEYKKARETYDALLAAKPSGDWTNLAKSRIIFLDSNGL